MFAEIFVKTVCMCSSSALQLQVLFQLGFIPRLYRVEAKNRGYSFSMSHWVCKPSPTNLRVLALSPRQSWKRSKVTSLGVGTGWAPCLPPSGPDWCWHRTTLCLGLLLCAFWSLRNPQDLRYGMSKPFWGRNSALGRLIQPLKCYGVGWMHVHWLVLRRWCSAGHVFPLACRPRMWCYTSGIHVSPSSWLSPWAD